MTEPWLKRLDVKGYRETLSPNYFPWSVNLQKKNSVSLEKKSFHQLFAGLLVKQFKSFAGFHRHRTENPLHIL